MSKWTISIKKAGTILNQWSGNSIEEGREWVKTESKNGSFGPLGEFVAVEEEVIPDYRELRRKEYPTWEEVNEAQIENMEGRPEKLNIVMSKRAAVKAKYPKPRN